MPYDKPIGIKMTVHLELNLNDGLTPAEIDALLNRAMQEGISVPDLIGVAIREMLARKPAPADPRPWPEQATDA
jgi:hypothetical protein